LDAGIDPKIVSDRIGHANMAYTLAIYTNSQELHQAGEETAGQQVAGLSVQSSVRADASLVTWDDPGASPSAA
jgi:hypothetical protein